MAYMEFFIQQLENAYSYQAHIKHYKNTCVLVPKTFQKFLRADITWTLFFNHNAQLN